MRVATKLKRNGTRPDPSGTSLTPTVPTTAGKTGGPTRTNTRKSTATLKVSRSATQTTLSVSTSTVIMKKLLAISAAGRSFASAMTPMVTTPAISGTTTTPLRSGICSHAGTVKEMQLQTTAGSMSKAKNNAAGGKTTRSTFAHTTTVTSLMNCGQVLTMLKENLKKLQNSLQASTALQTTS